jgi:adenylyltransferase/sulfurtransferase
VLGVVPGLIGMIQATEATKLLLGKGNTLVGRLLLVDTLQMTFREMKVPRNPDCVVCGEKPSITRLIDYEAFCGTLTPRGGPEMNPADVIEGIESNENLILLDVREPVEWSRMRIDGATLIPLRELPRRLDDVSSEAHIVCYCATGIRSAHAAKILRDAGFSNVSNLVGGIRRWAAEGHPVAKG